MYPRGGGLARSPPEDGKRYRITYEDYSASWDEWVTATRLRPRAER